MRVSLLLLFFLFSPNFGYCQIDSILSLRGNDNRLKGFIDWASHTIFWNGQKDQERKIAILREATEKFAAAGDEKLIREGWFFSQLSQIGGAMWQPPDWNESANKMLSDAGMAHDKGWDYTEVECRMAASTIYFNAKQFTEGFQQSNISIDIIQKIGLTKYPEANRFVAEIAERYYSFTDYETAILYFQMSLQVRKPWPSLHRLFNTYNTLALSFRKLDKYDSAIFYFKQANLAAINAKNSFWTAFTNGNLGYLYCDIGRYEEALPLLLNDFEVSKASNEIQSAAKAAIALGTIYIHKKNLKIAKEYLSFSQHYTDTTILKGQVEMYYRLGQLYNAKNDYRKAYAYLDSSEYFNRELSKQVNVKVIGHTKLVSEAEKYTTRIKLMEAEEEISNLIRNGIITGILFVCIVALLTISRIRAKKNNALKTAMLEQNLVADELLHANLKLKSFTTLLKEKSKLVDQFTVTVQGMQLESVSVAADITNVLSHTTILTEEDWKRFRELFDKVDPGFFIRLKEKIPNISPADMRLSALLKLKLSQKEMGAILGVSYDAIRKGKQRLRAKINLDQEISTEEFVDTI